MAVADTPCQHATAILIVQHHELRGDASVRHFRSVRNSDESIDHVPWVAWKGGIRF